MLLTFEEIYNQNKDLVYNLALHYTQNVEDAEEIAQDVFVRVYQKLHTFKSQSTVKTWLYRITINQSLDFLKSKQRKKRSSLYKTLNLDDAPQSNTANFNHPGVELEQREAVAKIFQCLNMLPDNQKNVIILLKIEQMSQSEAAEILGITPKAVESLFQRSKKKLENLLTQNEGK